MTIKLNIAEQFSPVPLGRYRSDGETSGEVFRDKYLFPQVSDAIAQGDVLEVNLHGLEMLSSSFCEEAFGGLVRVKGLAVKDLEQTLRFVPSPSHFDPYIENIWAYIRDAGKK